ncbi:sensor domain-containing diguanylate cyclase [Vibrio plantisponsor]|uniref:Sensor domain-containing diguanylate cyclase n=1 Tax=Vibrio plantisponsor TaxID=664643 RepID=A0ABU4IG31_9VIBR|nr:sensor domain-containing diguanylate cyclase [Vibrio plantisponsor]MDW6017518.1 sensor domain-containing diguanylate cyclase [Vibrio plantisponsor]NNM40353.1 GGDEF domain-containing protein [Vibrio plantisponsor]
MPTNEKLLEVIKMQTELTKLGLDLGAVMQRVVDRALPLVRSDGAVIELADDGEMVYRAASGIASNYLGLRLEAASSLSGLCIDSSRALVCSDSEADSRVDIEACRKIGLRSMLVQPLNHLGKTVGVLKVMSSSVNKFGDEEVFILGLLAETIASLMFLAERYDRNALFIKATRDSLTGLANKAFFMDRLRSTLLTKMESSHPYAIVICDLDGLKVINDNLGHRIGDVAIKEFANCLRRATRELDTVARIGGDEFGIISPLKSSEDAKDLVQRLEAEVTKTVMYETNTINLKASIGFSLTPQDGVEVDHLLDLADQRMYSVKRNHYQKMRMQPR